METFEERRAHIKRTGRMKPLRKAAKFAHMLAPARNLIKKAEVDHRGRKFVRGSRLMWTFCEPGAGGFHAWRAGAAIRSLGYRPVKRTLEGRRGQVWIDWPTYIHGETRGRPRGCADVLKRVRGCRSKLPRVETARQGRPPGRKDGKPRRGARPSPASVAAAFRQRETSRFLNGK
jgi:hypothetical protein